jgi:hypothetical protein
MNEYQIFKAGPKKGQPKTLTDRVVRYLVEGVQCQEAPSRSKYRQFERGERSYFVGKNGAVRAGKNASNSISVTDQAHAHMKIWEAKLQADAEQNINCLDKVIR